MSVICPGKVAEVVKALKKNNFQHEHVWEHTHNSRAEQKHRKSVRLALTLLGRKLLSNGQKGGKKTKTKKDKNRKRRKKRKKRKKKMRNRAGDSELSSEYQDSNDEEGDYEDEVDSYEEGNEVSEDSFDVDELKERLVKAGVLSFAPQSEEEAVEPARTALNPLHQYKN